MMNSASSSSEIKFGFDELFFSQTDPRGVILLGNEVFVRMSGYPLDRLLGAPHNIIRHPDIPKAVFKLFWQRIQSNLPVVAYVKNRAADGRFYWVLASAFPTGNSILSIRLRPSSALFEGAKALYQETLEQEKKVGMDGALTFLAERIGQLGFRDYDAFMLRALQLELEARDRELARMNRLGESSAYLGKLVSGMSASEEACRGLMSKSDALLKRFQSLRLLSTNLSVHAKKLGDGLGQSGGIFAVISLEFQSVAQEIVSHLSETRSAIEAVASGIESCFLNLAFLKLQTDMLEFMRSEASGKAPCDAQGGDMSGCAAEFTLLANRSISSFGQMVSRLNETLNGASRYVKEIQQHGSGLELIRQTGSVELARLGQSDSALRGCIEEMQRFNSELNEANSAISKHLEELKTHAAHLRECSVHVARAMENVLGSD